MVKRAQKTPYRGWTAALSVLALLGAGSLEDTEAAQSRSIAEKQSAHDDSAEQTATTRDARIAMLAPAAEDLPASRSFDLQLAAPPLLAIPMDADGNCRIWLQIDPSLATRFATDTVPVSVAAILSAANIEVEGALGNILQLYLPHEALARLAEIPGAGQVLSPARAFIDPEETSFGGCDGSPITSQGLPDMRVPEFRELGFDGSGVRIGIIDVGFARAGELIGSELPADTEIRYFGGADPGTREAHGTACAEIVHDVAPGAKLYLAGILTAVDLQLALQWLIEERVEVVSHSLAWFLGGGDGTGPICDLVADAHAAGLTFVTASGNYAQKHWRGIARDADADSLLELVGSRENVRLSSGTFVRLALLWDRWPTSEDVSFDIEILDGTEVVGSSARDYTDSQFAVRDLAIPFGLVDGSFRIRLRSGSFGGSPSDPNVVNLQVFRLDSGRIDPADAVPSGSLTNPADSPFALAVGAYSRGQELENFSSFGPTVSGLMKPEVLGPDGVCTSISGSFVGTSAACPHVAGAVGLLLSARIQGGLNEVHWSDANVRTLFESAAATLDGGNVPGATGWGRIRMPLAAPAAAVASRLEVRGFGSDAQIWFRRYPGEIQGDLRVYDVRGRFVSSLQGNAEGATWMRYRLRDSVPEMKAGRYWAVAPSGRAETPLLWLPE